MSEISYSGGALSLVDLLSHFGEPVWEHQGPSVRHHCESATVYLKLAKENIVAPESICLLTTELRILRVLSHGTTGYCSHWLKTKLWGFLVFSSKISINLIWNVDLLALWLFLFWCLNPFLLWDILF